MNEKRQHPRFAVALDMEIGGFALSTSNLSVNGLQCSCPGVIYDVLKGHLDAELIPITVTLPQGGPVSLTGTVVYQNGDRDEMLLGIRLEPDPAELWTDIYRA